MSRGFCLTFLDIHWDFRMKFHHPSKPAIVPAKDSLSFNKLIAIYFVEIGQPEVECCHIGLYFTTADIKVY